MVKADYVNAIGILLGLSKEATKELNKLGVKTVEEIFEQYKKNAIQVAQEREHSAAQAREHAADACWNKAGSPCARRVGRRNKS